MEHIRFLWAGKHENGSEKFSNTMFLGGICFITDRTVCSIAVEQQVKIALDAGVRFIQYREKDLSRRELYFQAEVLRKITEDSNATYIVNDHCDIALAVGADGVHIGQDDLPLEYAKRIMGNKLIGISTHGLEEAQKASRGGADYIGFGPIYHTTTKDAGAPKGKEMLNEIRKHIQVPIVAIGGIGLGNLRDIFDAGANAVAVASAILRSDNVSQEAKAFVESIQGLEQQD